MSDVPLVFAIPPSMGEAIAADQAAGLQSLLDAVLEGVAKPRVYVAPSYADVSLDLLQGRCDLAWGPPSVCARLEVHGGRALVQAVRAGGSSYRSVVVCRDDVTFAIDTVHELGAAWVDPDSTGGYLLACAWFARRGVDVRHGLKRQRFAGSYEAAVRAVVEGEFDLTAVYASAASAARATTALDELPAQLRERMKTVDFTPETPNDGIAARPGLDPGLATQLSARLCEASADPQVRARLAELLQVTGFEVAEKDAYRALHELVLRPGA